MINNNVTTSQIELENQQYLTKVFGWMFTGLITTAIVSYYVSINMQFINPLLFSLHISLVYIFVGFNNSLPSDDEKLNFLFKLIFF